MQDAYVGDVGDFGKYGLLRALCARDPHGEALRLGVLWYRCGGASGEGPGDGSHTDYIFSPYEEQLLQQCDPALWETMRELVSTARTISGLEASSALPTGTAFFNLELSFAETPRAKRQAWLEAELPALRYRRRSPRVYFVLARPEHAERLIARTDALLASCWGRGLPPHFQRIGC